MAALSSPCILRGCLLRSRRPVTYEPALVSEIMQTALSRPQDLGEEGDTTWTLDRRVDSLHRVKGWRIKRRHISDIFIAEELRWRYEETWGGERVDPDVAKKRGPSKPSPPARHLAALPSVSTTWVQSASQALRAHAWSRLIRRTKHSLSEPGKRSTTAGEKRRALCLERFNPGRA